MITSAMDNSANGDVPYAAADVLPVNGDENITWEGGPNQLVATANQINTDDYGAWASLEQRRRSVMNPLSQRPDFVHQPPSRSYLKPDPAAMEAKLGKVFALSPLPTLVLDKDLHIICASDGHLALTGYTRNEYLRRRIYDLPSHNIPTSDVQTLRHAITTAIATNTVQSIKDINIDCGQTNYFLQVVPIFEDGTLLYLILTAQNMIIQRPLHRNKPELLYIDETYRILVDTVKDYAIYLLDPKGYVSTWNSGATLLKGYSAEEVIGQHFSIFYGYEDRAAKKPIKELEVCLQEGRVEDEGWRYRKDGTRFWANTMLTPVYRNGKHVGFAKVTRDLTERKAAEGRLIAAFEESSKLKSDFLANMSHEIRTPMHGMLMALTILASTELDEVQREYVSIIEDTGSVLLQIINDVLDYSKISSGTFSITPGVLDVDAVISAVARNCKSSLKPGVTLETHTQPGFPKHIEGDPLRYRQIMQNFVGNAVKFTENGSIKIHTTYEQHDEDENAYEIRSEVIDTGIGVSDDSTSSLFTPFGRFANTSQKLYQGAGLGLSICKSLAELMDGSVGFYANPEGRGSVFWFAVKMAKIDTSCNRSAPQIQTLLRPASPTPDPNVEIARIAPTKQLLLVEDNMMNQTIMLKLLSIIGFEKVDTAWDGAEAVRKVKQKPLSYNAILMDINMPVMNGVEATVAIRKINSDVPIIAMTGNALKGDAENYLAKGMSDYVAKPVHRLQLIKVLLKWMGV